MTDQSSGGHLAHTVQLQHGRIRELVGELAASDPEEALSGLTQLSRQLAIHDAAEEAALHRPLLFAGSDAAPGVQRRLNEAGRIRVLVDRLEGMDSSSDGFVSTLAQLRDAVHEHAAAQESEEVPAFLATMREEDVETALGVLRLAEELAADRGKQATVPPEGRHEELRRAAREVLGAS